MQRARQGTVTGAVLWRRLDVVGHIGVLTLVVGSCDRPGQATNAHGSSDSMDVEAAGIRVAAVCYRSPHSMLLGPPTVSGQQGKGPGWIGMQSPRRADSGWAQLVDPGSKAFGTLWRRDGTDSIALRAGDDFLQVAMRLAVSDSLVAGSASAWSDAAVERDSTGRMADLRREWTVRAVRASCDSMPPGWRR